MKSINSQHFCCVCVPIVEFTYLGREGKDLLEAVSGAAPIPLFKLVQEFFLFGRARPERGRSKHQPRKKEFFQGALLPRGCRPSRKHLARAGRLSVKTKRWLFFLGLSNQRMPIPPLMTPSRESLNLPMWIERMDIDPSAYPECWK